MSLPEEARRLLEEGIKAVSYCPICETQTKAADARFLHEQENTHLLHLTCNKCGNAVLALVLLNSVGVSSIGLMTDLSVEDVWKLYRQQAVSADDVLDAHVRFSSTGWQASFKQIAPPTSTKRARARRGSRVKRTASY